MKRTLGNRWDAFWVHGLISGRWSPFWARYIRGWVLRRPSARALHHDLQRVGNVLSSRELSAEQENSIENAIFSSWPVSEQATLLGEKKRSAIFLPAMTASSFAVVAFMWISFQPAELTSRGGLLDAGKDRAALGVELACLEKQGDAFVVAGRGLIGASSVPLALRCEQSSVMTFTTTNLRKTALEVFVVGVDDDGALHWLPPFSKGSRSISLPAGGHQNTLDEVLPLDVYHGKRLMLYALFDESPFSQEEVEAGLNAAKEKGIQLQGLSRLPLDVMTQNRIQLEVSK